MHGDYNGRGGGFSGSGWANARGGHWGRGRGGGRGGNAGGPPAGAPTGPADMRGAPSPFGIGRGGRGGHAGHQMQQGGFGGGLGARGGSGVGGRVGDTDSHSSPAPAMPLMETLNPEYYKAPRGDYIDQVDAGSVGIASKYDDCLRCRKPKIIGHPRFEDCHDQYGFCNSRSHQGAGCRRLWCSERWWLERLGAVPADVQRRPSEPQRQQLAEQDRYFASFPPMVQPLHHPPASKKRMLEEVDAEAEAAARAVLRRKLNDELNATKQTKIKWHDAEKKLLRAEAEVDDCREKMEQMTAKMSQMQKQLQAAIEHTRQATMDKARQKYQGILDAIQTFHEAEQREHMPTAANAETTESNDRPLDSNDAMGDNDVEEDENRGSREYSRLGVKFERDS